jgi:hypothetical protein
MWNQTFVLYEALNCNWKHSKKKASNYLIIFNMKNRFDNLDTNLNFDVAQTE